MGGVAVQPIEMRGIDGILHRLEPVAMINFMLLHSAYAVFPGEHIPARQQRPRLGAHISPDQSPQALGWIRRVFDLVLEAAFGGFRRLLQTFSGAVELPAVIRTANAFFVDAAKS